MEHRQIGSLEVSVVGLGCNNFGMRIDADAAKRVVDAALDAGITFFDTADVYGGTKSEEMLGAALAGRRQDVVVATKFGNQIGEDTSHRGAGSAWVKQATEDSLRRLGTDCIDLQQLHRPDKNTPIEETLGALDGLVRAGKVREFGSSNFSAQMVADAETAADRIGSRRFVSVQNQLSLLQRDALDDVLPLCEKLEIGFVPYFPLASGLLTGKYRRGEAPPSDARLSMVPDERRDAVLNDRNFDIVDRLTAWAADSGKTILDLAMAWLIAHPAVASVIAGATKPEQVVANVEAAQWQLTPGQVAEVTAIAAGDTGSTG